MTLYRPFTVFVAFLSFAAAVGAQTAPPADESSAAESSALPPPRTAFAAGQADFAASNYPAAARAFLAAADSAAQSDPSLPPSVARYNAAVAADRAGDPALAAAADSAPDPALQAKAFYNRGISLLQLADQAAATPQIAPPADPNATPESPASPSQYASQAVDSLSRAVLLDPDHLDAKINYEIALRKLDQYRQMEQQQQQSSVANDSQDQQDNSQDQDTPNSQEFQESQPSQESQPQDNDSQQDSAQPQEADPSENETSPQPISADPQDGEMTEEEARLLMDMMRDEEQALRDRLQLRPSRPVPVEKDW